MSHVNQGLLGHLGTLKYNARDHPRFFFLSERGRFGALRTKNFGYNPSIIGKDTKPTNLPGVG